MRRFVPLVICIGLIVGCGSDEDLLAEFEAAAAAEPLGFTRTDAAGNIAVGENGKLVDDTDDWRTSPIYHPEISIRPVYPNPTFGEHVVLEIFFNPGARDPDGLELRVRTSDGGDRLVSVFDTPPGSGILRFTIDPENLSPRRLLADVFGLNRILVLDARGDILTYGDLMIPPQPGS